MEPSKSSPEIALAIKFREFIHQLAQKFDPLHIYSFSLHTSIQQYEGCFQEISQNPTAYSDHCLLVMTDSPTRIDYEMQDYANTHYAHGTVTLICHGTQSIKEAVDQNSRFFISVLTKGKLLYSQDGLLNSDPIPRYIPTNGAIKATKHFKQRMPLAESFLMCAAECLEKEQFGICAFMLHQAVEQSCIGSIRVHIAYRSEFHNLYRLLRLCKCFSSKPLELLLSNAEDKRLFAIMAKSYSASRYKDNFNVSKSDAENLYQRVASFLKLTNEMCLKKIALLEQDADAHVLVKNIDKAQIQKIETTATESDQQ